VERFDIIIKNGRIWDGNRFLTDVHDVAVRKGIIEKIGSVSEQSAEYVFDAKGAVITPGLVDIHTHMRGFSCDAFGFPSELACFPFGVTTAADAGTEKMNDKSMLENLLLNCFMFVLAPIRHNDADLEKTDELMKRYGERVVGLKVFFDTASPEVKDIAPLKKICDYAHARGLKVMVHSSGSPVPMRELFDALEQGDICTHIFHGGVNSIADDFSVFEKAFNKGIILDAGMAGGVHTDFMIARQAIEQGLLPHTISTDITRASAFVRGGIYGMTLAMSMMREFGMSEEKIYRAITDSAAKALGQEHCCGRLEVGRTADIAVIHYTKNSFDISDKRGNNVKSEWGYQCLLTVRQGQVVYRSCI